MERGLAAARLADPRRLVRGWRAAARDIATKAGLPDRAAALGAVVQPGGVPCQELLAAGVAALGLPRDIIGTRLGRAGPLQP